MSTTTNSVTTDARISATRTPLATIKQQVKVEWVEIAPAMATALLDANSHNRRLREAVADGYARDMTADRWDVNGETIKICADGRLIDGQHRLEAIEITGIAAVCLLVTGLPIEAQKTTDIGARRSYADTLRWEDVKNGDAVSAIVRRITLWNAGYRAKNGRYKPTEPEMSATFAAVPGIIEAADFGVTHATGAGIPPAQLGFAYWLLARIDAAPANWFMQRIADGAGLQLGHPALVFRDRLRREREALRGRGSLSADLILALLIKAWNCYRAGDTITKLQLPTGGLTAETFPIPK
ncbi:hypothetical protein KGQ20_04300 [Catenulispora sp. NF23]|uniref:ParB/Sulfiredoxin domain-containing protein n=1 Tax=Catenulispora pinistramenti TaxID=2705254 RepID=A0ABS5L0W1_9ACTN|nr:hypothetical protein [Catenulispora pinistramenti]MBS2531985.1 hypothetical protein [Catenulispora pinistramenti]MBS2551819.1 hypothetical protein [Catenulispora pinistramenti]